MPNDVFGELSINARRVWARELWAQAKQDSVLFNSLFGRHPAIDISTSMSDKTTLVLIAGDELRFIISNNVVSVPISENMEIPRELALSKLLLPYLEAHKAQYPAEYIQARLVNERYK